MTQEMTGVIVKILPVQTGIGPKGKWEKQEIVVKVADLKNTTVCFLCWGYVMSQIEKLKEGDAVEIEYYVSSREHEGRWYTQAGLKTIALLTSRAEHQFEILFVQLEKVAGVAKSLMDSLMPYDPCAAANDILTCLNMIIPASGLPEEKQKTLLAAVDEINLLIQVPIEHKE